MSVRLGVSVSRSATSAVRFLFLASFAGGALAGNDAPVIAQGATVAPGVTWIARDPNAQWADFASSSDGFVMIGATGISGEVRLSTDGGVTWSPTRTGGTWQAVAANADGSRLAAADAGGRIWISTNGGASWTARASDNSWQALAMSADGATLAAVVLGGSTFHSTDGGTTWSETTDGRQWTGVAMSATGDRLAAVVENGALATSTDGGATWTDRLPGPAVWRSVAMSADGQRIVAAADGIPLHRSLDGGATWAAVSATRAWYSVAMAEDGQTLVAAAFSGPLAVSLDGGGTWTDRDSTRDWLAAGISGDGRRLVAGGLNTEVYTSADARQLAVSGTENGPAITIILDGSDGDGDDLVWSLGTAPLLGDVLFTETGTRSTLVYTPRLDTAGQDAFEMVLSDGAAETTIAIVVTLDPSSDSPDRAPTITSGSLDRNAIGVDWTNAGTLRAWRGLAGSRLGSRLFAAPDAGPIARSVDGGDTWTDLASPTTAWRAIATSADGSRVAAVVDGGRIHVSTDAGVTWTPSGDTAAWSGVTMSGDGLRIAAAIGGGRIHRSTDGGTTWQPVGATASWTALGGSGDGERLIAVTGDGIIAVSADAGATWTDRVTAGPAFTGVSCSTDGQTVLATAFGSALYRSTNGGTSWTQVSATRDWSAAAVGGDGEVLAATALNGRIAVSTDGGTTWTDRAATAAWKAIAAPRDGALITAAVDGGVIATSRTLRRIAVEVGAGGLAPLALTATDPDDPASLAWTVSGAANGTASLTGSGTTASLSYVPDDGFTGVETLQIRVVDAAGGFDLLEAVITVTIPVDAVPVITQGPAVGVTMSEDGSPTPFSLALTASDPGDTLTWSILTNGTRGTATLTGGGTAVTVGYTPLTDVSGTDTVVIQVRDAAGQTATTTVTITIQAVNDPPIATFPPSLSGTLNPGSLLTAHPGTWVDTRDGGSITGYAYAWERKAVAAISGMPIAGATAATYAVRTEDLGFQIRVVVTATDNGSPALTGSAPSAWVGPVVNPGTGGGGSSSGGGGGGGGCGSGGALAAILLGLGLVGFRRRF